MERVEPTMTNFEFPEMRVDIISALKGLANENDKQRIWRIFYNNKYQDFDEVVHILYDDTEVLTDPASRVGTMIRASEVAPLKRLDAILSLLIEDLGDAPDSAYMADRRWPSVVSAARHALQVMLS